MADGRSPFPAVRVSDRVWWVGAVDWAVRDFHGYATSRGSTYNAYLIAADSFTLVDTVKAPFRDEMMGRIASVVDPGRIEYIISNHSEMDHSGCLPETIAAVRPKAVLASAKGVEALGAHFRLDGIRAVKDGERMRLGGADLVFAETRMLHWPDSMVTYLPGERLLFSQDAFGMHLASGERFDDELPDRLLEREAAKYYANILMPYAGLVRALPGRLSRHGIDPRIIAPDHGPVWRGNPGRILELYARWAERRPEPKAVIVYDTMWGSTHRMARAIGEGVAAAGAAVRVMPLGSNHRSDVATEILDAGALIVGSPTINNTIFPTVADALCYLRGLKPKNLVGAAFGSHGWSGEAVRELERTLREMKVDLVGEGLGVQYVPDAAALARCAALGGLVAERLSGRRPA
ncbi:MAG: FprA family A-type flavoprotein [bacterium]|nr:FprA family A-type flavoprotein [bacterium]